MYARPMTIQLLKFLSRSSVGRPSRVGLPDNDMVATRFLWNNYNLDCVSLSSVGLRVMYLLQACDDVRTLNPKASFKLWLIDLGRCWTLEGQ